MSTQISIYIYIHITFHSRNTITSHSNISNIILGFSQLLSYSPYWKILCCPGGKDLVEAFYIGDLDVPLNTSALRGSNGRTANCSGCLLLRLWKLRDYAASQGVNASVSSSCVSVFKRPFPSWAQSFPVSTQQLSTSASLTQPCFTRGGTPLLVPREIWCCCQEM